MWPSGFQISVLDSEKRNGYIANFETNNNTINLYRLTNGEANIVFWK